MLDTILDFLTERLAIISLIIGIYGGYSAISIYLLKGAMPDGILPMYMIGGFVLSAAGGLLTLTAYLPLSQKHRTGWYLFFTGFVAISLSQLLALKGSDLVFAGVFMAFCTYLLLKIRTSFSPN